MMTERSEGNMRRKTKERNGVFCRKCKFESGGDCEFKKIHKQNWEKEWIEYENCRDKNKNNDCKEYLKYVGTWKDVGIGIIGIFAFIFLLTSYLSL